MIEKLHKRAELSSSVDIMRWLNFTTFDITGDLTYGDSFDSLKNEDYNSWIANVFRMVRISTMIRVTRTYPIVGIPLMALLNMIPALAKARHTHRSYTLEKTTRRLEKSIDRKDFIR